MKTFSSVRFVGTEALVSCESLEENCDVSLSLLLETPSGEVVRLQIGRNELGGLSFGGRQQNRILIGRLTGQDLAKIDDASRQIKHAIARQLKSKNHRRRHLEEEIKPVKVSLSPAFQSGFTIRAGQQSIACSAPGMSKVERETIHTWDISAGGQSANVEKRYSSYSPWSSYSSACRSVAVRKGLL